jgi:hypothetical protein
VKDDRHRELTQGGPADVDVPERRADVAVSVDDRLGMPVERKLDVAGSTGDLPAADRHLPDRCAAARARRRGRDAVVVARMQLGDQFGLLLERGVHLA